MFKQKVKEEIKIRSLYVMGLTVSLICLAVIAKVAQYATTILVGDVLIYLNAFLSTPREWQRLSGVIHQK